MSKIWDNDKTCNGIVFMPSININVSSATCYVNYHASYSKPDANYFRLD